MKVIEVVTSREFLLAPALTVGYVVARDYGVFKHVGIVSDRWLAGYPMILTNSWTRGVVEISWAEFADGGDVKPLGHWGTLPGCQVVARARSLLGRPYRFFGFSCDHFVRHVHGLRVESPQLQGSVAVLAVVAAVGIAARARR